MHPQGAARRARRQLRQARHHAGHQRAAAARRRQDGAAHHQGLPRRARGRPRQPHPAVQSALPSRAAADPARAALRGGGADGGLGHACACRSQRATSRRSRMRCAPEKIEALAISFLNAYVNPAHEQAAAGQLRKLLPGVFVTTGSELTREWHEFERTATAAANAYVGPQVSRYIAQFDGDLRAGGFTGSLLLMGSHGGVISAERGCREPITLVESGPVGGCIGAASFGSALGIDNLVAFDMGGTTSKCALIERGRYAVEFDLLHRRAGRRLSDPRQRDRHPRGRRRRRLDRLARRSASGSMSARSSAGSMPGPACYDRGGVEPAVTDAHLRARPARRRGAFLGGEMNLAPDKARAALASRIAEPLGYTGADAVDARRQGRADHRQPDDVVDHQEDLDRARLRSARFRAVLLRRRRPAARHRARARAQHPARRRAAGAGQFLRHGHAARRSAARHGAHLGGAARCRHHAEGARASTRSSKRKAARALRREFGEGDITFEREAEIRYKGQQHSLKIALPAGADAAALRAVFDREYRAPLRPRQRGGRRATGGAAFARDPAYDAAAARRLVDRDRHAGATAAARTASPRTRRSSSSRRTASSTPRSSTATLCRSGSPGRGPALIEEYGSSTLIGPRDSFAIGKLKEIDIDCSR